MGPREPVDFFNRSQNRMAYRIENRFSLDIITALKTTGKLITYYKPFFVTVLPGFRNPMIPDGPLVDRQVGDTYSNNWNVAFELNAHTVLITSWN